MATAGCASLDSPNGSQDGVQGPRPVTSVSPLCPICGSPFTPEHGRKYCKPECSDVAQRGRRKVRDARRWIDDPIAQHHRLGMSHLKIAMRTGRPVSARKAVYGIKASGGLPKPTACRGCGGRINDVGQIDGHHVDHFKPLDLAWLCKKCHCREEAELRRLKKN